MFIFVSATLLQPETLINRIKIKVLIVEWFSFKCDETILSFLQSIKVARNDNIGIKGFHSHKKLLPVGLDLLIT